MAVAPPQPRSSQAAEPYRFSPLGPAPQDLDASAVVANRGVGMQSPSPSDVGDQRRRRTVVVAAVVAGAALLLGGVLLASLLGGDSAVASAPAGPPLRPREALEQEEAKTGRAGEAKSGAKEPRRRCEGACQTPANNSLMSSVMKMKLRHRAECKAQNQCPIRKDPSSHMECVDGFAGEYPCKDVDLLAMIPLVDMGSGAASDIWGWTDSVTGKEYALIGLERGSAFVDVTDPEHPEVVGLMSSHHQATIWHDIKVYKDHAFVVSEASGHGMQVFDLSRLRERGHGDSIVVAGAMRLRRKQGASVATFSKEDLCLESAQPATTAAGDAGTVPKPKGDRFLEAAAGHVASGGGAYLRPCIKHRAAQQWRYEQRTGQLQDGHGLCADFSSASGDASGGGLVVHMQPCNVSKASQRWSYDADEGAIRGPLGLCLGAPPSASQEGSRAFQAKCNAYDETQVWQLGARALQVYEPVALYHEVGSSHNVAINEETGMAYIIGSQTCHGGLHMVNVSSPAEPEFVGCYAADGYTHDSQCVVYEGPDSRYTGREICFNYDEDSLTIVDVTNKYSPKMLSRVGYNLSYYTHQGWLDKKSEFLFLNDELDEMRGPNERTRTMVWDVRDLEDTKLVSSFYSNETSIDHNLYVDGNVVFETNYCAGLRVLEIVDSSTEAGGGGDASAGGPGLKEVGYFDVAPDCSVVRFMGSWSNYPYYKSGIVVVSSMERGLFILRPKLTGRTDLRESRQEAHRKRVAKGLSS
eukprot:CAMPEP_0115432568 /NCGR_PEP_ID=MMETSP0271-20121206/32175_1 /TAXON_ID=71861 /ORGANISM="Scrippsiella trochoidea, Strain CCMP3099" /LENGTH=751 /DNA_ID=CAMNT_0002857927 /DNA_START=31 /DNA_END=2286 /DNA_ORIENTATION=-